MIPIILASIGLGGILGWAVCRIPKGKRKIPSLTKYVAFSIGVLIVYTIAEFTFSWLTSNSTNGAVSHDTLTTCVYACFGGEILSCALIKIFKLKEENNGTDNA